MPRQRRIHVSGGLYHAVLRGNHRQAIFGGSDDYLCFEEIVARAAYRRLMRETPAASERDALSPTARLGRAGVAERDVPTVPSCDLQGRRSPRSLEIIATEVALARDVTVEALRSKRRRRDLVQARREIARRALLEGAANLSQVARYLNRAPSTISDLLQAGGELQGRRP